MATSESKRSRPSAQLKRRRSTPRTSSADGKKKIPRAAKARPGRSRRQVQVSPELYRTLASINECLKTVSDGLDTLQAAELVAPKSSELRKAKAEELRADINATITINMHSREMDAAYYHEQERLKLEKRDA
jgi:hypothetical protein